MRVSTGTAQCIRPGFIWIAAGLLLIELQGRGLAWLDVKMEKQQRLRGTGPERAGLPPRLQPRQRPGQRGGASPLGEREEEEDVVVLRLEQSDGEIRYITTFASSLLCLLPNPPPSHLFLPPR